MAVQFENGFSHTEGSKGLRCHTCANVFVCIEAYNDVISLSLPFGDFIKEVVIERLSGFDVSEGSSEVPLML